MSDQTTTATVTPPADTLTAAQRAENDQKSEDRAVTKLGHAVEFLNNHLPAFGGRSYAVREDFGNTEIITSGLYTDDVPAEVRSEMTRALASAARFANECFNGKG